MCLGRQFIKSSRFAHLQDAQQVLVHALGAHFNGGSFRQSIRALEAKRVSAVDVVKNWLVLLLFCVCQLSHADNVLSAIEPVKELLLHLFPTVNGLRF